MVKFENGRVYKNGLKKFVLVYFEDDKWGMLFIDRSAIKGLSCPMFQHDENHNHALTRQQLIEKYNAENWKKLDGRLRIEKIDDITLTEYPIGGELEEIDQGE